jgi:hypothetical protein
VGLVDDGFDSHRHARLRRDVDGHQADTTTEGAVKAQHDARCSIALDLIGRVEAFEAAPAATTARSQASGRPRAQWLGLEMYAIQNCVEVYVDACVRNEAGQLMFMSVFGRDTATRELMARIQLASGQDSLRELSLVGHGPYKGESHTVQVADAKELDKLTGRCPRASMAN